MFLCAGLLITSGAHAVSATIFNDDNEQINVRISFKEKDKKNYYWSKWHPIAPQEKAVIKSKKPEDSIFSFAILVSDIGIHQLNKSDNKVKGYIFQVSNFRAASSKRFTHLPTDIQIYIRDSRIDISAAFPKENMYWFGEHER